MNIWMNLVLGVQLLAAVAIIGLVLIQHGKGADMGASFGSGASGSLFGATGSANFLSRSTAVAAAVFFASTLAMAYFGTQRLGGAPTGTSVFGACVCRFSASHWRVSGVAGCQWGACHTRWHDAQRTRDDGGAGAADAARCTCCIGRAGLDSQVAPNPCDGRAQRCASHVVFRATGAGQHPSESRPAWPKWPSFQLRMRGCLKSQAPHANWAAKDEHRRRGEIGRHAILRG